MLLSTITRKTDSVYHICHAFCTFVNVILYNRTWHASYKGMKRIFGFQYNVPSQSHDQILAAGFSDGDWCENQSYENVRCFWSHPVSQFQYTHCLQMWHFIPNFHTFSFLVWYTSGSRFFSAFLVELGAEIMVASTIVPPCMICPVASITRLIALKNTSPRWFSSSKWRNFRSVVASGACSSIKSIFMNFRNA